MNDKMILELADEVSNLCANLEQATEDYAAAVSGQDAIRSVLSEAKEDLVNASSEIIYEATIQAKAKEGPLAGLAVSNAAAMKAAHTKLLSSDKVCVKLSKTILNLNNQNASAEAATDQALQRMRSLRTRTESQTTVLAALSNIR